MTLFDSANLSLFLEVLDNKVLWWALIACGFTQLSKLFFELIFKGEFRLAVLIETGGMPSSHSALVTGTASGIGLVMGFEDPIFALASTLAFIVMYDASGVRRAAGNTAGRINKLPSELWPISPSEPLKESLGHTRLEVLVGSLLGPAIALPGIIYIGSPLHVLQNLGVA